MKIIEKCGEKIRGFKQELAAIYLACKDPRTPWYAKALGICIVGYALSPIDLIPDPIPVLGYLDDLILIPLGVVAAREMIPRTVMAACREKAKGLTQTKGKHRIAAGIVIAIWIVAAIWTIRWLLHS